MVNHPRRKQWVPQPDGWDRWVLASGAVVYRLRLTDEQKATRFIRSAAPRYYSAVIMADRNKVIATSPAGYSQTFGTLDEAKAWLTRA